jgi:pimeloyl-ACP methyl ester carboxylesterase
LSVDFEADDNERGEIGLLTLYDPLPPTNAIADIVFIHGLGGGSRKTWSYSPSISHYWPQEWLPIDPDFEEVRVHTFGYNANWDERRQSILSIHDFAQSLVNGLLNNPAIRRSSTRIVLVGHSMGGCVAKKAYILAHQDPACKDLAERIHSIFFLGTPHGGSNLAQILASMLTVTFGKKPFVSDLIPTSSTLSEIDNAFRYIAPNLRLWSFYETLQVNLRMTSTFVVERRSASLGLPNEQIASMSADHRQLCKFGSPRDPNYILLRNALHASVDMIRANLWQPTSLIDHHSSLAGVAPNMPLTVGEVISRLRSYLGIADTPDDDLTMFQVLQHPHSCQWFTGKELFTSWMEGRSPSILWLTGKPATGKSVLSSHVIDQMKMTYNYCSYFYFKHAETGKSLLSDCFRALVFQMASQDKLVREKLLQLEIEGVPYDKMDEMNVWRKFFIGNIFKLSSIKQHSWVIDGLDECVNHNALFSKRLLETIPKELRIFVTSRNLEKIERGLVTLGSRVNLQTLSDSDTIEDMRTFLSSRLQGLVWMGDEEKEEMCKLILRKSSGSFLWVRLVLQEIEDARTEEAMETVMKEVPEGLHELYSRMVQNIESDKRTIELAKSILTLVLLTSRSLTMDELRCGVKLDVKQTLRNMEKVIPNLCGQLVFVDQWDKAHTIHETAREFLLQENLDSPLAISKATSHSRLASMLLRYLTSDVLRFPHGKSRGFSKSTGVAAGAQDTSLVDYAAAAFSDHLYLGTSKDETLSGDLCNFLNSNNLLLWIENLAKNGDIVHITKTAVNMRGYLNRRSKYTPPTDPALYLISSWVVDLIRVAAKFQSHLLDCPSAIHNLIPALCPSNSIIAKTFGQNTRASSLVVKGLPDSTWDDCLTRFDFQDGQATVICHGDRFFAIGLSTGRVSLYDPTSFQPVKSLTHPERVRIIIFSQEDQFLVTCGTKFILVHDLKFEATLHTFEVKSTPLALVFLDANELLCVSQDSSLTTW